MTAKGDDDELNQSFGPNSMLEDYSPKARMGKVNEMLHEEEEAGNYQLYLNGQQTNQPLNSTSKKT